MEDPSKLVDRIVGSLSPSVKAAGYRKAGNNFWRDGGGLYRVLQFQKSRWNSESEAEFTANLLVIVPEFHVVRLGKPFPRNPTTAVPVIQERIGMLMPARLDHWWRVPPHADVEQLSAQVQDVVSRLALPFLESFPSRDELLGRLSDGQRLPGIYERQTEKCHAVLLMQAGDRVGAERVLRAHLAARNDESFAENTREFAARLGLDLR